MKHDFIPRDATVADLEEKAAEYEQRAEKEGEPLATELLEQARVSREWLPGCGRDGGVRERNLPSLRCSPL